MRTLRVLVVHHLNLQVEYATFRLLCSLRLTHLALWIEGLGSLADAHVRDDEAEMPPVTDTWQWLKLQVTVHLSPDKLDAVLTRYGADARQLLSPAADQPGLQFLSLRAGDWPETVARVKALAWSLTSLELLDPPASFDPLLLTEGIERRPLLPYLRHLLIGRSGRIELSDEAADDSCCLCASLLHAYKDQLRCLSLHTVVSLSLWWLVRSVFPCSQLRRVELHLSVHKRTVEGDDDVQAVLTGLRPLDSPSSLPPLPLLHTLALHLPLNEAELKCILQALSGLQHLAIGRIYALDALQLTRLVAQHASPGLRTLSISSPILLSEESVDGETPSTPTAVSAPSPIPFPAVISFTCHGPHNWSPAAVQSLVELLRHAPLRYLQCIRLPLRLLHHLAPLSHLVSLITRASFAGRELAGVAMPVECWSYFHEPTRADSAPGLVGGEVALRRRLLEESWGEALTDDEAEVSDEELEATNRGNQVNQRHRFVQQRLFEGRDGREAYMEALRRRSEEKSSKTGGSVMEEEGASA